jgi:plastocyanin
MLTIRLLGVTALLALPLAASAAGAGEIRGVLYLTAEAEAADHGGQSKSVARFQQGVEDAVIYVERIPPDVERRLAGRGATPRTPSAALVRIALNQRRFVPRVSALVAGASAEFRNRDSLYHNTFSISSAKRFDLGRFPPGRIDTVRFDRPGVVNLHCEIHPEMIGYVVVVPNHALARPDLLGAFALPALPKGDYTLRVWHPRRGEITQFLRVPSRGPVRLEVRY